METDVSFWFHQDLVKVNQVCNSICLDSVCLWCVGTPLFVQRFPMKTVQRDCNAITLMTSGFLLKLEKLTPSLWKRYWFGVG